MRSYFAYIRVSTVRQGEKGSSLQEQRDAIELFARRNALTITAWFMEMETAAKTGRREFARLLTALRQRRADGVLFHKIDRGARNLKDWNKIQELIESGIDVRFAHESLDLNSRGGRLTADLLAIIAADYVRNLREEIRKGMRGRLKQGLYPLPAPLGYKDAGGGRPKLIDPLNGPLVRSAFELYATGEFGLIALAANLDRRGLRTRRGKPLQAKRLGELLRNPFYVGLIAMRAEVYEGVHEPLVPKSLFDAVQVVIDGRLAVRSTKQPLLYRCLIRCAACGYALVGERQKGHIYYRCHSPDCKGVCMREELATAVLRREFEKATLADDELDEVRELVASYFVDDDRRQAEAQANLALLLKSTEGRLDALTTAFLDGALDRDEYDQRKRRLLDEKLRVSEELANVAAGDVDTRARTATYLELAGSLWLSYERVNDEEKRELLKIVTSNLVAPGNYVAVELRSPFSDLANRKLARCGGPLRQDPRTSAQQIADAIIQSARRHSGARFSAPAEARRLEGDRLHKVSCVPSSYPGAEANLRRADATH